MALTNYERQKRWREKNRVIYNLRRRNARKNLGSLEERSSMTERSVTSDLSRVNSVNNHTDAQGSPSTQTSKDGTLARLRDLVKQEEEKPVTEVRVRSDVVGGIYRNDFGGVISKMAYEKLKEKKRQAKEGGYILDEYSQ